MRFLRKAHFKYIMPRFIYIYVFFSLRFYHYHFDSPYRINEHWILFKKHRSDYWGHSVLPTGGSGLGPWFSSFLSQIPSLQDFPFSMCYLDFLFGFHLFFSFQWMFVICCNCLINYCHGFLACTVQWETLITYIYNKHCPCLKGGSLKIRMMID